MNIRYEMQHFTTLQIIVGNIISVNKRIVYFLGLRQRFHVDHHGQLALKQLRLSVLNEMHTNSYTGPRLKLVKRVKWFAK